MEQWTNSERSAPQFEHEQVIIAAERILKAPPDLEAMAIELDRMKVDAAVDAERTRPGLNGFFALVLGSGIAFIITQLIEYRERSFDVLTHPRALLDGKNIAIALGLGCAVALAVGTASALATRRTRHTISACEQQLIELGGTPLPERGKPLPHPRS